MSKRKSAKSAICRTPASFTYKSRRKEITGRDDNKHLLFFCYLDSLRWLIWPALPLLIAWLRNMLSG